MGTPLKKNQKIKLTFEVKNAAGLPNADYQGFPQWGNNTPALGSLVVAPDKLSAYFIPSAAGTAIVTMTVDGDMGAGTSQVVGSISLDITDSQAASVAVIAAAPEAQ